MRVTFLAGGRVVVVVGGRVVVVAGRVVVVVGAVVVVDDGGGMAGAVGTGAGVIVVDVVSATVEVVAITRPPSDATVTGSGDPPQAAKPNSPMNALTNTFRTFIPSSGPA